MLYIILASRCLLFVIFLVAAVGKLLDLPGSRRAVRAFGVPEMFAGILGTALPVIEFAAAVALLFARTAWWGALIAMALLACFVVAICVNLMRGKTPDCHCFGQFHSAPAGPATLIRNLVLAAVATLIVAQGAKNAGSGIGEILSGLSGIVLAWFAASLAVAGVFTVSAWFMLQLFKQNGRLLLRLEALEERAAHASGQVVKGELAPNPPRVGLPLGSQAPEFALPDTRGQLHTLQSLLLEAKPLMLLFIDPECGPCKAMLPNVASWHRDFAEIIKIVIISRGKAKETLRKTGSLELPPILLQETREVAAAFQCHGTPGAVWIDGDGTIRSDVGQGSLEIEKMFEAQRKRLTPPIQPVHRIGDSAPEIILPNLFEGHTRLADFLGKTLVVLFWNPSCGYCLRMIEDLKLWERNRTDSAPQLLIASTGSREANRNLGLRSPIVLDDDFLVGKTFNATGTPSAVLLDERGALASPVATGQEAVRSLLGFQNLALRPETMNVG